MTYEDKGSCESSPPCISHVQLPLLVLTLARWLTYHSVIYDWLWCYYHLLFCWFALIIRLMIAICWCSFDIGAEWWVMKGKIRGKEGQNETENYDYDICLLFLVCHSFVFSVVFCDLNCLWLFIYFVELRQLIFFSFVHVVYWNARLFLLTTPASCFARCCIKLPLCNTLHHTVSRCNTLQHAATH